LSETSFPHIPLLLLVNWFFGMLGLLSWSVHPKTWYQLRLSSFLCVEHLICIYQQYIVYTQQYIDE
jgi:hypothetical protein